jgi:glycosyltransferase involved in cell wall biosynthesis
MPARRILLISHEYPPLGGVGGNAARHIAKALARMGHKPYVLTAAGGGLPRDETSDGVTIHRLPLGFAPWKRAALEDGYPSAVVDGTAFFLAALRAAPRLARQWKVEITLAFFALPAAPLAWLLKWRLGIPYIVALQGGDVREDAQTSKSLFKRAVRAGVNFVWRGAGAVIANSERLAEDARRHDPRTTIRVIPGGADVYGILPKDDYTPQHDVKLLFVGRVARGRGLDVLLEALAKLSSALKWKLAIVGDGPEWPAVAAQAARNALIDRVELRGWQGWNHLPEIYRGADIFVLPAYDSGMPAALLEAMATGLPVIAARAAGMAEAVLHDETGVLVPPRDSDALADALTLMIADPARWEAYGRAGRARIETYYSWTVVTETWMTVIEDVLSRAR